MKHKKIVFDGQVYAQRMTGQYRYADEILRELDNMIEKNQYEIVVPNYVNIEGKFKNIKVVHYGNVKGLLWTQTSLLLYLLKNNAISLNFCNITTFFRPGISVVYDISYKYIKDQYTGLYGKCSSLWHRLFYWWIARNKNLIITDSFFSKNQIEEYYKVSPNRISVIGCGWQHYNRIQCDDSIFEKYKILKEMPYYLAMGSLEERKNFKFIVEIAKRNPEKLFVITGGAVKNSNAAQSFSGDNVIYTGFISDEFAKSLMKHAKAFIFPSTYEGFGIPPLEAMSVGTGCICSSYSSIPEVCGDSAYYFDPFNYDINLDDFEIFDESKMINALNKYSWNTSAKKILNIINQYGGN